MSLLLRRQFASFTCQGISSRLNSTLWLGRETIGPVGDALGLVVSGIH